MDRVNEILNNNLSPENVAEILLDNYESNDLKKLLFYNSEVFSSIKGIEQKHIELAKKILKPNRSGLENLLKSMGHYGIGLNTDDEIKIIFTCLTRDLIIKDNGIKYNTVHQVKTQKGIQKHGKLSKAVTETYQSTSEDEKLYNSVNDFYDLPIKPETFFDHQQESITNFKINDDHKSYLLEELKTCKEAYKKNNIGILVKACFDLGQSIRDVELDSFKTGERAKGSFNIQDGQSTRNKEQKEKLIKAYQKFKEIYPNKLKTKEEAYRYIIKNYYPEIKDITAFKESLRQRFYKLEKTTL